MPDPLLAAGSAQFDEVIAALAGLLVAGALISGVAHRSFLSLTALFESSCWPCP